MDLVKSFTTSAMPPLPDPPETPPVPNSPEAQAVRWQALLEELRRLNAKLEYVSLMLRLGVRNR